RQYYGKRAQKPGISGRGTSMSSLSEAYDDYFDCPIGDSSRWLKTHYEERGLKWSGAEPEEFSPKNRKQENQWLLQVLYGERPPRTKFERRYLDSMGGPRAERPEQRWRHCLMCGGEWLANGCPSADPTVDLYPTICDSCADRMDARAEMPKAQQQPVAGRKPYADPDEL
ncbi:MAG TPA: hypothetical protein VHS80_13220, partial [Chthoniobacterales bacterium]|nr:hypothetical protein [Chthoniobacterales bacterium]